MASPELKYKGMTFKIENRKYNVKVTVRKGEEDKVSAKHHGLKGGISGGYFSDPFEAAQMADKIYACLGRPQSESNQVISEAEYTAAASDGWEPLIEYIKSRNLSISGLAFSTGMSNLRGVTWHAAKRQWQTMMNVNGKPLHIFSGKKQMDAALAYDSANHYVRGHNPESKLYKLNYDYKEGIHATPSGYPDPPPEAVIAKIKAALSALKVTKPRKAYRPRIKRERDTSRSTGSFEPEEFHQDEGEQDGEGVKHMVQGEDEEGCSALLLLQNGI